MLGYVHLLPEVRPALERRTVAGTALWVLEGDLDGGLLPRRRLRRWTRRLAECGVSHAALPPGREAELAPIRPVLPDGLRLALLPRLLDCLAPAGDTALLLADRADSRTLCAARVLAERNAAVMVLEKDCTPQRIMEEIQSLLADPQRREAMSKTLRSTVRLDSTQRICDIVEGLVGRT